MFGYPYLSALQQVQASGDYNAIIAAFVIKAAVALALARPVLDLFDLDEDGRGWRAAALAAALVFGCLLLVDFSVFALTAQKAAEDAVVALLAAASVRKGQMNVINRAKIEARKEQP
jgi:general stress protein CsbA